MTASLVVPPEQSVNSSTENGEDESGLEIEAGESLDEITEPFDPTRIKINTVNVVVLQIVQRIEHDAIDLAPDFQRLRGIWNIGRKSRLIESLLLRIPIPVFYVAADEEDNWAVVDGLQRISTINDYVTGEFALEGLGYLNRLEGLTYQELPWNMQRRISETQLIINVIQPGTPEEVMFNVFLRINTGGMTLNGQEIRHALNPGPVREYLKDLAETKEFRDATDGSIGKSRMADRECVLRFLAFHITPPEQYSGNDMDGYLGNAMKKINSMTCEEREEIAEEFKKAMCAARNIFGSNTFRKPRAPSGRRRPVNRAVLETWSVQLAHCASQQIDTLVERRDEVQRRFSSLMEPGGDLDRAVSSSTGSQHSVRTRFRMIEDLIGELV